MEYLVTISVATFVLVVMFPAIKRGVQSVIKVTADQVGMQEEADQDFSEGFMIESTTNAVSDVDNIVRERGYTVIRSYDEAGQQSTHTESYLGFSEEN